MRDLIKAESVSVHLQSDDKDEVFEEMVETLVSQCPQLSRNEILGVLHERENKMTTGIGSGIAIPHAISKMISSPVCALGISRSGIDYEAIDGKPVHIIFMIVFPESDAALHLNIMQHLANIFSDPRFYQSAVEKETAEQVLQVIFEIDESES